MFSGLYGMLSMVCFWLGTYDVFAGLYGMLLLVCFELTYRMCFLVYMVGYYWCVLGLHMMCLLVYM